MVRVEFGTAQATAVMARYGIEFTPTFLLFDTKGQVVERRNDIDASIADRLRSLAP